ncbi:MAG: discoidin domain-containing protein [Acidobacteriota bacterium]
MMNRTLRYLFMALSTLGLCVMIYAQTPGRVKVELQLPKPRFIGTPKNLKTPNLEPARTGPPPTSIMVPAGTKNIALNKPVTASDNEPVIGEIDQITDGDKEGVEGSYVEFGPGTQWVQIDLQKPSTIYDIVVWHFHNEARVYRDVVIQVSDDKDFTTGVKTIFNNDHDNSSGLGVGKDLEYIETFYGRIFDAKAVKGRYVRLYSKGNTANEMNHMTEVEVYGKVG